MLRGVNTKPYKLQLWADSFHEGQWACEQLGQLVRDAGGTTSVRYINGYQPVHLLENENWSVEIAVYGDYDAWEPLPFAVATLISWGKPDLIAYDEAAQRVLFAVEESAATPTGNQATQRCERQYGCAREGIPFWYLLSEFGIHLDGGVRRDSIWPTVMALKITQERRLPSVVLHYSDLDNPEDYTAGSGLVALFSGLLLVLENAAHGRPILANLNEPLVEQYSNMIEFLTSQWKNQIDFLPGEDSLKEIDLAANYALAAVGSEEAEQTIWNAEFLCWPKTGGLNNVQLEARTRRELIKHDNFAYQMETDIAQGHAYGLSGRSGSRPQPLGQVEKWIMQQQSSFSRADIVSPPASLDLKIAEFPRSPTGLLHLTTSRRTTILYDNWSKVCQSLVSVFPRLAYKLPALDDGTGVFVYISNSVKPGRIFGDPFTGQIAALATAFGKWDNPPRYVLTYFPHQTHAVAVAGAQRAKNKGINIVREMVDLAIFAGGVGYLPSTGEVL